MQDAPEGRVYNHYEWKLKFPDMWHPRFTEDYVQVVTPHIVSNGKWLLEKFHGGFNDWSWLIGITHEELDSFLYTDKRGTQRVVYTSDKPFGYIYAEDEDVDKTVYPPAVKASGQKRLVCARQVHKGELGQTVPIERLDYVRQGFEPGTKPNVTNAHMRRRGYGWIRLTDLSAATGLTPEDIVQGFWQYSGHRNYWTYDNDQDGGQLLDVVFAIASSQIKEKEAMVCSLTRQRASSMLFRYSVDSFDPATVMWIRRGFAYTVLRLLALGVRPEVAQPV